MLRGMESSTPHSQTAREARNDYSTAVKAGTPRVILVDKNFVSDEDFEKIKAAFTPVFLWYDSREAMRSQINPQSVIVEITPA